MKFRLEEGNGEAYYNMGYEDDGQSLGLNEYDFLHSLSTLCYLSLHSKSELILNKVKQGQEGKVAELEDQWTSPMEDDQMSKARTFYIYKSQDVLAEAMLDHDPIAAIVIKEDAAGNAGAYSVFKVAENNRV